MKCACGKHIPGVRSLRPLENVELAPVPGVSVSESESAIFASELSEHEAQAKAAYKSARFKTTLAGMVAGTLAAGVDPRFGKVVAVATAEAQKEFANRAVRAHTARTAAGSVLSDNRDLGKTMVSGACSRALEAAAFQNTDALIDSVLSWTKWLGIRGKKKSVR
jgi:hypothetical protein